MTDSRLTEYAPTDMLPVFAEWVQRHGVVDAKRRFLGVLSVQDLAVLELRLAKPQRGHFRGEA